MVMVDNGRAYHEPPRKPLKLISFLLFLLLVCIVVLLFLSSFSRRERKGCLTADVIILIDISGSVKGHEDQINAALVGFVDDLDISDAGIHAGIIAFSDNAQVLCQLTGDHDKFDDTFRRVKSDNGNTNMKSGAVAVLDELTERGRPDAVKVVIVISDGATEDQDDAARILESLQLIRTLVCSVLIKNTVNDEVFMKRIGGNCYLEADYRQLYRELQRLDFCL